jgi:hypothetical protein
LVGYPEEKISLGRLRIRSQTVRIRGMHLIFLAHDKYKWRDLVKDDEIFDSIKMPEIY